MRPAAAQPRLSWEGGRWQHVFPGAREARWAPASSPYSASGCPSTGMSNREVFLNVDAGYRMPRPPECPPPPATHKLMRSCWHRDPEQRPCFRALRERLSSVSRYENPL